MIKNIRNFGQLFSISAGLFLFFNISSAQTTAAVTSTAGDQSLGSLGWAVTTLNNPGGGAITVDASVSIITLTQPLAASTQNVTLQGGGSNLQITGQDNSQSQVLFQQGLNQQLSLVFQNGNTLVSGGLDASLTVSNWTMASTVYADVLGGAGAGTTTTGGTGVVGQAGGNVGVTVGTWTVGQGAMLGAGAGGNVNDTNGSGDVGGQGGSVTLVGNSINMLGSFFNLAAGGGGAATDLGSGTNTGGAGGSAYVSFNSITSGPSGNFQVTGGNGGNGLIGGDAGGATAIAGAVTLTSGFSVVGGIGGSGMTVCGASGDGYVSFGSYTGLASSNLDVQGGRGQVNANGTVAADGGDAFYLGGSMTINGPGSNFQVKGGDGGNLGPSFTVFNDGGNGGNASVSLGSLALGSTSLFQIVGGAGGSGSSGSAPANGGLGGNTTVTLGSFSIGTSTVLTLSSGNGGVGGSNSVGGVGGIGGAGGDLSVSFGNLNLGSGSILNLKGGDGGAGGASSGGTGGNGGASGGVNAFMAAVSMQTGDILNISGGTGGAGGTGSANGSAGTMGFAFLYVGDLEGGGSIGINSPDSALGIGQGNYSGSIYGGENLLKSSTGALTLSGPNYYSGGTSIVTGTIVVDTNGTLGTGGVEVVSAGLDYIHSSVGVNAVTVDSGGTLSYQDTSSAGLATIILNNGGMASFTGGAQGGIAGFTDSAGATLDISGSTAGGVTIGSLSGGGLANLGANILGVGSNGASTTFSGLLSGTGSLALVGGGLTLSNANSYSGGTDVAGGTLTAANAQALGSTGSVTVNGGTLATAGPLTLFIGGNYLQSSTGNLQLNVAGANAYSSDALTMTGTSSINGDLTLVQGSALTAPLGSTVTILDAGVSVSGMFQQVNESLTGIRFLPVYFSNAVELESIIPSFQALGATPNQVAIGADLDSIALNARVYSLMSSIGLMPTPQFRSTLDQMSPEDLTALYQAGFEGARARAGMVGNRMNQLMVEMDNTVWLPGFSDSGTPWYASAKSASKEPPVPLKGSNPWSGFISGNGGFFNVSGDGNAAGYQVTNLGLTGAGADYRFSREARAGILLGYDHTSVTPGLGGTLTADGGEAGLYGLYYSEGFFADALVEGGLNSYSTQRPGYNGTATGSTQGLEYDGSLELGYLWKQGQLNWGPLASMQYSKVQLNSFTEQGSQAPLTVPNQSQDSLLSRLGLEATTQWALDSSTLLNPFLQVAWEHEYNNQGGNFIAGFGAGDNFTVAGPQIGQDGILASVALNLTFSKTLAFGLTYQGELARTNLSSHQVGLGIKAGF